MIFVADNIKNEEKKEEVEVKVEEPKETKKEAKKASGKVAKLVDEVSVLSVLELSELVESLQKKLGVSATAPTVAAAAPAAEAPAGPAQGGGAATQTVVMTGSGGNKIAVIKALREINQNLTLVDAKNMTETLPAEILKDAKSEDAASAVEKLKTAGATVEVK